MKNGSRSRFGAPLGVLALAASGAVAACAHDRILPVHTVCGDGRVTGDEECDAEGPGCHDCRIVNGWDCPDDQCAPICGDGTVVGDEQCDPPDDVTCDRSCKSATSTGCNIDGYFIARQTNYARDTVLGQIQTSTNWYFYRFSQNGEAFQTEDSLYCGLSVSGTVNVSLGEGGYRALLHSNQQGTSGVHGPRRGVLHQNGDSCELSFDRWYLVRGVEESFLPDDFLADPTPAEMPKLPSESDPVHPTRTDVAGATDDDGDGLPGLGLQVTGALPGVRSVVHRDWDEYFPDPAHPNALGAIELTAISDYDNEENVLSVTGCDPAACAFLVAGSTPARNVPGHVVFRYLGKSLSDPRVAAFTSTEFGADEDADLEACRRVREALPPDTTPP
ncbi:MAG TPA: DUF4215 domain-containing protein [Polyangiaceae bacterium]|nr:DUF4215 domain-containing protein [Polyangiaceae bacterium]